MAKKKQEITADGIPVYCAHDDLLSPSALKPCPSNPNKHPDEQIRLLAKNIKHLGRRHPITVSNRSGQIVAGHARRLAAMQLGVSECPVDYQDFESEEAEHLVLLSDNVLSELSELDMPSSVEMLVNIDAGDIDLELSGWSQAELERIMTYSSGNISSGEGEGSGSGKSKQVTCPECGAQFIAGKECRP